MPPSAIQSVATIDQFISQVGTGGHVKAADGSTPLSEPGSIGGETKHPVKSVDDRLQKHKEGERSSENSKDVKEDQGEPSVENAAEAKSGADRAANIMGLVTKQAAGTKRAGVVSQGGSAEDDQMNIGLRAAPTGEDSSNETGSAKAGKEDKKQGNVGGTSTPFTTENDKIDGHKWAADTPLAKMAADMREIGNELCAQIAWLSNNQGQQKTAQAAQQAGGGVQPQAPPSVKQAQVDPRLAQQIGWEMAGLVNGTFDKNAADQMVIGTVEGIIKNAADDADRFINFMEAIKQAEGEEPPPPEAGGGGGEPPPPGGGGGGEEDAMMSALGGGADAGGGMGGEGGGGGGAPSPQALQLAQVLEGLGVGPEELESALQEMAGGGGGMGGGAPPPPPPGGGGMGGGMGGGAPPPPPPPPGGGMPGMEAQANDATVKMARQVITELIHRSKRK